MASSENNDIEQQIKMITNENDNKITQTDIEYSFEEIEGLLSTSYDSIQNNNSTICDVIAIYLKGQKILYTEAKTLCEQRLTSLMLPAILFTVTSTITNLILSNEKYGPLIGSILNGFVSFILAIVNYLKLDARAEAHRTSAYKFDKLISYVEFNSGKVFFIANEYRKIGEIISYIENNVREIKETNQFVLPEKIRFQFPKLTSINIFAEVKRRQNKEAKIVIDITKLANKILELDNKIKEIKEIKLEDNVNVNNEKNRLIQEKKLLEQQRINKEDFFYSMKNELLDIDTEFETEMKKYRDNQINRFNLKILDYFKV
jgi:hypothetical protein